MVKDFVSERYHQTHVTTRLNCVAHYQKSPSDSNEKRSAVLTSIALAMARMFLRDGFLRPLSMPER